MNLAKIAALGASLIVAVFCGCSAACAAGNAAKEYIGYPASYTVRGSENHILTDSDGSPTVRLQMYDIDEKVAQCIQSALGKQQVRVTGDHTDGELLKPLSCEPIKSVKDCPQKKMGSKSVTGIYKGTDCGDNCYIFLQLPDGKTYDAYADPDEVEKLFGPKPGKRVLINVNIEQFWMPEGDDINGPGFCMVGDTFAGGKVLE